MVSCVLLFLFSLVFLFWGEEDLWFACVLELWVFLLVICRNEVVSF